MKYSASIIINKPIDQVIELLDSFEYMKKWQLELQTFEHLSGESWQPGARTRLVYQHSNRRTEIIENVEVRDLPREFSGRYEMKGVINKMSNSFEDLGNGTTQQKTESEFTFSGPMKYFAWMMKGSFTKMTQKIMNQFKMFAEST